MTSSPLLSITIKRSGFLIEIEGTGASVTFYPYDKDRTFEAIIEKCKELGDDLTLVSKDHKDYSNIITERHNIDIQLTQIYGKYYDDLENKVIKDEDLLLAIANSQIKCRFIDQTGRFYAVIQKGDNNNTQQEIVTMDYEDFDTGFYKNSFIRLSGYSITRCISSKVGALSLAAFLTRSIPRAIFFQLKIMSFISQKSFVAL